MLAHRGCCFDAQPCTTDVMMVMMIAWLQLFEKMSASGAGPDLRPNLITYSVLIAACRTAGKHDHAVRVYMELHQHKLVPNAYIFHAMLASCKEGGLWRDGLQILRTMQVRALVCSLLQSDASIIA